MNHQTLSGKTVLITGGNTGIGKETARGLAQLGASVVLACRNLNKAQAACDDISQTTGNSNVSFLPLDLSSLQSVRAATTAFKSKHQRLDILINNAGVVPRNYQATTDGFEMQFGVNHLGHFLLTNLLLDLLKASAPARVIHVSSTMHHFGNIDFDSFRKPKFYFFMKAYAQSKLANVLFSNELARQLANSNVTSNALHPGPVKTEIYRDLPEPLQTIVTAPLLSPQKGALTSLYVATSAECGQVSGKYFAKSKQAKASKRSQNLDLAKRLWDESANLCGL